MRCELTSRGHGSLDVRLGGGREGGEGEGGGGEGGGGKGEGGSWINGGVGLSLRPL